jgi:DNA-binding protein H-NS
MAIDLSGLSVAELEKLIESAKARIEVVKRQKFSELRRSLEAQAREAGFDVYDLFSGARTAKPAAAEGGKRAVAPKYRNPANHLQTWTGRGKQPHWVRDALAGGASLDTLAIK